MKIVLGILMTVLIILIYWPLKEKGGYKQYVATPSERKFAEPEKQYKPGINKHNVKIDISREDIESTLYMESNNSSAEKYFEARNNKYKKLGHLIGNGALDYSEYIKWKEECFSCAIIGAHISMIDSKYAFASRHEIESSSEYMLQHVLASLNLRLYENIVVLQQTKGRLFTIQDIKSLNIVDNEHIVE